ncbi:MAG TPA: glycosyltransferase family 4 protein, partial [Pirellulaceae bacterium]|nr:glycosyltransferase family 4 protein [Pirellulaceae bacterium]
MPESTLLTADHEQRQAATAPISSQQTLRVLHVINGEHYSGAERVQDLLGLRLPEFGVKAGFVCVKPGKFAAARLATKCQLVDLPMGSRLDLRAAWRMAKIIRAENYALVHCHTPRSLLVGRIAAGLAGVPVVYHVHSPTSRDTTHSLRNWFNAAAERVSLTGVSRLICVSNSLGQHMQQLGYRPELISVVHNGVPCVANVPPRATPTAPWTLGMVALFRPRKGLEVLLAALAELRQQGHDVRLRAIGPFETPEYQAAIMQLAAELRITKQIDWVGFTRDVNHELNQTDLFVLPSLFGEGLPMVVLEAMAAGIPVVGTAIEGIPEAIRDGQDGVIAQPNNPEDLAAAIGRVITGEISWQALRESALQRHAEHFSDR